MTATIDINGEVIARIHCQNRGAPQFPEAWDERVYLVRVERNDIDDASEFQVRNKRTHGWDGLLLKVLQTARAEQEEPSE